MLKWTKTGRIVYMQGDVAVTNIYDADGGWTIEARKTRIPHSNRSGYWERTFFWVLKDGKEIKMLYALADAKSYVEQLIKEEHE